MQIGVSEMSATSLSGAGHGENGVAVGSGDDAGVVANVAIGVGVSVTVGEGRDVVTGGAHP